MSQTDDILEPLTEQFARLPGIGRRTAERLAYHVVISNDDIARALSAAIETAKSRAVYCQVCSTLSLKPTCPICADETRDRSLICVVQSPREVALLEAARSYRGLYHVLRGHIAPLEGVGPNDLTIGALVNRVKKSEKKPESQAVREVILATNRDMEGDFTAEAVADALAATGVTVTRLGRGLAAGTTLDSASKTMLEEALSGRRTLDGFVAAGGKSRGRKR
jgi:recombination protein RecR